MENYEIVYYPTIEDVKQMIDLDGDSYKDDKDCGVLSKCMKWLQICPDIYTIVKIKGQVVGYINFVPITLDCYNKFKTGSFKDYMLETFDILPFKKGDNFCLFMSIVTKEKFRNSNIIIKLIDAFKKRIFTLKEHGCVIKSVVADCVSPIAERFVLNKFNARYISNTESGSKIYEFKIQF